MKGDLAFYSRRIGRRPSHTPDSDGYVSIPDGTRILGAAKVTGKTQNGLSVGTLMAVAAEEEAIIFENGSYRREIAEPQTQYVVTRIRQEFDEGGTAIGGIFTGTFRGLDANDATLLTEDAITAGADFSHRWLDRTHFIKASIISSHVSGSVDAIDELQRNYLHNYIRPDADHLDYDPSREELKGWGGNIEIGKDNGGHWRYETELDWRSPGLELNDVGFIDSVDQLKLDHSVRYVVNDPGQWFNRYSVILNQKNRYLYDGTVTKRDIDLRANFHTKGNWNFRPRIGYDTDVLSTGSLRGGPAIKLPGFWTAQFNMSSDGSKDFLWWMGAYMDRSVDSDGGFSGIYPGFQFKPGSRFRLNCNLTFSKAKSDFRWFGSVENDDGDSSYFLAGLDRDTFGGTIRFDYNFTPNVTLTYYGNLYITSGGYRDYKLVTDPQANDLEDRFYQFGPGQWSRVNDSQLELRGLDASYLLDDNDFNYRSFRSNLVFRWEYRPGSILYVVWSHDRENSDLNRDSKIGSDLDYLTDAEPNNTLLIKASYWFSI